MAKRSIRDWIRRKRRGRKAMTSGMRDLIDSFDAHQPSARPMVDAAPEAATPEESDRPSNTAQTGTHA